MTKTEKKELYKEKIAFNISKSNFKKAIKSHKRFCNINKDYTNTPQENLKFTVVNEKLYIESTDGFSALISELEIIENFASLGTFFLPAVQVFALSLTKSKQDILYIESDENIASFLNVENNMNQSIFLSRYIEFPNIKDVVPKDNNIKIRLTTSQIKDIAGINSQTGYVNLLINSKDANKAILIETDATELTSKAIIMPWKELKT